MNVEFRRAEEGDIPEVLALWEVAAENDSRPTDDAGMLERLLARDADALDLAVLDDRIVGTLISGWDGWRAHLYRLAVHPEARRRGIGTQLLARARNRLVVLGATRIDAMVLDGNDLGQTIWSAEGFTRQPDWSRWVRPVDPTSSDPA